jgi:urease accessory protein
LNFKSKNSFEPLVKNLALMYLSSPALPIGTFAWSRGLESATLNGQVSDLDELSNFLQVSLKHSLGSFDLPILAWAMTSVCNNNYVALFKLNDLTLAGRETYEFRLEEVEGGRAIKRLMLSLNLFPSFLDQDFTPGLVVGYALLASALGLEESDLVVTLESYAFSWLQNQISAAARILKLGQSSLQNLIMALGKEITEVSHKATKMKAQDLGSNLFGLAMLSAHHEQEHSRLFRS